MKRVLLTGGSRGIGKAIRELLAENGYDVYAPSRSEMDLSNKESILSFIQNHQNIGFDIIINNAGINPLDDIPEINDSDFEECMKVNLMSPFMLIRGFTPYMIEQRYGRIINISSIWSVISKARRTTYSISKTGIIGLTRTAAVELGPYNILVNSVSPGFINTELTKANLSLAEQKQLAESVPLQRLGEPREIAELVVFLVSDRNTFLTGQNIIIDGGFTVQ